VITTTLSVQAPLALGAEQRLTEFTELFATAAANTEASELAALAEEQVALRRVATLVAQGVPPKELFWAVSDEVSHLFGASLAALGRFEPGEVIVLVGGERTEERWKLIDVLASTVVFRTGRSARVDAASWEAEEGETAERLRSLGIVSSVASPIMVEGQLWGTMLVASTDDTLPAETEQRLERFTDLVATAIANTHAREQVAALAREQASLRRIATLVAQGFQPGQIFEAVSEEVAALFDAIAAVQRFEGDVAVVIGVSPANVGIPIGTRWGLRDGMASAEVYCTQRSVRIDETVSSSRTDLVAAEPTRLRIVSQVGSPIIVEGRLWGTISVNSRRELPRDTEERLEKFTELVATAIANAEGKSELAASRRRIVTASDDARRRIERDLHDGTQQRLVSLGLAVRAVEVNLPPERDDLRTELDAIATGLANAVDDLQEISRGIHPAILSNGGLEPALATLARRSGVPVELELAAHGRLPESIEVATYYVVSEALANAAKHSEASRVDVTLAQRDGHLLVSVRDDGVGGADARRGSGLVGLADRVEALGGSIRVSSRPGDGTEVSADLPIELIADADYEPASAPVAR
jgi:signal transduction histidine kinase